jgi:hypothetical protein
MRHVIIFIAPEIHWIAQYFQRKVKKDWTRTYGAVKVVIHAFIMSVLDIYRRSTPRPEEGNQVSISKETV